MPSARPNMHGGTVLTARFPSADGERGARAAIRSRWASLDGLRGYAVIGVLLFHLDLVSNGFVGVDVFFVLSGFLITRLLASEYEHRATIGLTRFYVRRILRLYPALLAVVAFCLVVAALNRE